MQKIQIGEGGNWNVYRVVQQIKLEEHQYSSVIIKEPKNFDMYKIESYLKNYKLVQSRGIPTVDFCDDACEIFKDLERGKAIVCQDLNENPDVIYVSPNTLRSQDWILKNSAENSFMRKCEIGIKTICNIKEYIDFLKEDIKKYCDKVFATEDSFFFKVRITEKGVLIEEYKVADFDTICELDDTDEMNYNCQLSHILEALYEFCYALKDNDNMNYISREMGKYKYN